MGDFTPGVGFWLLAIPAAGVFAVAVVVDIRAKRKRKEQREQHDATDGTG